MFLIKERKEKEREREMNENRWVKRNKSYDESNLNSNSCLWDCSFSLRCWKEKRKKNLFMFFWWSGCDCVSVSYKFVLIVVSTVGETQQIVREREIIFSFGRYLAIVLFVVEQSATQLASDDWAVWPMIKTSHGLKRLFRLILQVEWSSPGNMGSV